MPSVKAKTETTPEAIAAKLAKGGELTFEDSTLFADAGWDQSRINREIAQQKAIADLQNVAGTSADREATKAEADAAAGRLAADGRHLRERIAELSEELTALQNAAATSDRAVARQQNAVEQLRRLAPETIRETVKRRRAAIEAKYRPHVTPLESEINAIETLEAIDTRRPIGRMLAKSHADVMGRKDMYEMARDNSININWTAWRAYVAERSKALPELREKVAEFKAQQAAELAEADAHLDIYAR